MKYHDTHFHLDLMKFPEKVVKEIELQKIYTIAVTNTPSVFFYTEKITSKTKYIRAALGLHPELAVNRQNEIELFNQLVSKTRYIGEIGLDNYNKTHSDYRIQKKVFEKIIQKTSDVGNKILTIHSRRASSDVLDILSDNFNGKVIMHWYSDSLKNLDIAIERGYFFSVNHLMFKSEHGKKIISRIPLNKILLETDGPFTKYNMEVMNPLMIETAFKKSIKNCSRFSNYKLFIKTLNNNFRDLII